MKKFFTLLAVAAMSLGANAQSVGFFDVTEALSNAQVITSVTDITATYGGEKSVDKTGVTIAKSEKTENDVVTVLYEEGADWKIALKKKAFKYTLGEETYTFSNYAEAVDNARGENFAFSASAPVYGGFVKYEPAANGTLVAYFYIPDNKAVVFTEINKSNEASDLIASGAAKIYVENGTNVTTSETGIPDATYKKTVGVLVCELKGGNTYYFMLNGSKLGVGGFIYSSTGETPEAGLGNVIADENAPVEYFNLQGIRINEPAAGQIVIRRQGSKVSKIAVR